MTITYEEARSQALDFLKNIEKSMEIPLSIVDSHVTEYENGWSFPYQSKAFLDTKDINQSIFENWPIFVDKKLGKVSLQRF